MASLPTSQTDSEPGQLLQDLEQRQDDVLTQLDDLDAKLTEVLKGLGVSEDEQSPETDSIKLEANGEQNS